MCWVNVPQHLIIPYHVCRVTCQSDSILKMEVELPITSTHSDVTESDVKPILNHKYTHTQSPVRKGVYFQVKDFAQFSLKGKNLLPFSEGG